MPGPGPGAPDDSDDYLAGLTEMVPEDAGPGVDPGAVKSGPASDPEPIAPDPPAARIPARPAAGRNARAVKVTAAVRADVTGKFGLMLEMGAGAFAARDPLCGGVFRDQLPQIREAAVELILQSPDLVAWFVGAGGGFMLWFNLAAACWPVAVMAWAHHIAHRGEDQEQAGVPAAAAYAA